MNHFTKLWLLLQAFTPLNWTCLLYSDDTFYQYITSLCKPDYRQVYRSHSYPVGIRLLRTPWGHAIVSVLSRCPYMKEGTWKKKFTDSWWIDVKTQTEFLNFVPLRKFFLPPGHSKQTSFLSKPKSVLKFTSFHPIFICFYTVLKSTVLKREMRVEPSGIKRKHQLRLTGLPLTRALEEFFSVCWNLSFRGRQSTVSMVFSRALRRFPRCWMKGENVKEWFRMTTAFLIISLRWRITFLKQRGLCELSEIAETLFIVYVKAFRLF